MEIFRKETRTGLLVVLTLAVLTGVLVTIGMPGLFLKVNTYRIYFDNASGVKLGSQVTLAGRKVGTVTSLQSPVPYGQRPEGFKTFEALVFVQMERSATVFRKVTVRMQHLSMLGEMTIDFAQGDPASGLALDGASFIGERVPDLTESMRRTLEDVKPVVDEAARTLRELQRTVGNVNRLTAAGSDMDAALGKFRQFGDNLVQITESGSPLRVSLEDLQRITDDLSRITGDLIKNDRIRVTLQNFQVTSEKFRETGDTLDRTVKDLRPGLLQTTTNAREMTDTLKRQPWRLLWPSTKKYPDQKAVPTPTPRRVPSSAR